MLKKVNNCIIYCKTLQMAFNIEDISSNSYEWLALPSGGKCYPSTSSLRVGKIALYKLTAKDLDVFSTFMTNIKRTGNILDLFQNDLQKLVVDDTIAILELCKTDVEMIMLWLQLQIADTPRVDIVCDGEEGTVVLSDVKSINHLNDSDNDGNFCYKMEQNINCVYRLLTFAEEIEIVSKHENNMYDFLAKTIVSLNGNTERQHIINTLLSMNYNELTAFYFHLKNAIKIMVKFVNSQNNTNNFINYSIFN